MPIYDLSEKVTDYGIYNIKAQSLANGYESSDFVGLTYNIGATIAVKNNIITIVNVIEGITAFSIYIDGVNKGQVAYDYSTDWSVNIADYFTTEVDGRHTVELCAIGVGVADNRSNAVTCRKGVAPIYGVSWVNDATTTMTRTDDAVGLSYAIQTSDGSIASDFNEVFPWSETVITTLTAGKFLKMPLMYFRVGVDNNGDVNAVAVSEQPSGDGNWYEVKPFYYGIYGASTSGSGLASVTKKTRTYSTTRNTFRTRAKATGDGYQQLDLYHKTVMNFLWWIEWATKNSESIMTGKTSATGSSQCNTGGTDDVSTPSGFNTSTKQMRYHYIEDFVGNYREFYDGISGSTSNKVWVCADASKYSDTVGADGYSQVSYTTAGNGWVYSFGWDNDNPFQCYYRLYNNTYGGFCDMGYTTSSTNPIVYGGASWYVSRTLYGLCYFDGISVSYSDNDISARLLYI